MRARGGDLLFLYDEHTKRYFFKFIVSQEIIANNNPS